MCILLDVSELKKILFRWKCDFGEREREKEQRGMPANESKKGLYIQHGIALNFNMTRRKYTNSDSINERKKKVNIILLIRYSKWSKKRTANLTVCIRVRMAMAMAMEYMYIYYTLESYYLNFGIFDRI